MNIIPLPDLVRRRDLPLVVFSDLQCEYVAEGRAHFVAAAAARLPNIIRLMELARLLGLPIAHLRSKAGGYFFNPSSRFSSWIEGCSPRANEMVFEHNQPSCFSNDSFSRLVGEVAAPRIVMAGFLGEQTCLCSAIDGFHWGCHVTFVKDCSASSALGGLTEDASHEAICNIIGLYADVVTASEISERLKRDAKRQGGDAGRAK